MKLLLMLFLVALCGSTTLAQTPPSPPLHCNPDQSGKFTICWYGDPPGNPNCDWRRFYCPPPFVPNGYGY
jgi:hypothetical protein